MKRLSLAVVFTLICAFPVMAAKYATIGTAAANIRSCGGTQCTVKWKAWKYTPVAMVGLSADKQWVKVRDFEGHEGWVFNTILSTTVGLSAKVDVNIRQSPSASAPLACTVEKGYALKYISKQGGWLQVEDDPENPAEGKCKGWVSAAYVWGPRAKGSAK